jgi:hypothetical protein
MSPTRRVTQLIMIAMGLYILYRTNVSTDIPGPHPVSWSK